MKGLNSFFMKGAVSWPSPVRLADWAQRTASITQTKPRKEEFHWGMTISAARRRVDSSVGRAPEWAQNRNLEQQSILLRSKGVGGIVAPAKPALRGGVRLQSGGDHGGKKEGIEEGVKTEGSENRESL
jgi:hypothetical protein